MKALLVGINSKYIHTALGIRYVAAYARRAGYSVDILEESINTPLLAILDKLMAKPYDVYGLDVHIWSRDYGEKLVALLHRARPEALIVAGGPEVSYGSGFPGADVLIKGEGERAFLRCLQAVAAGEQLPGGTVLQGEPCPMEALPFPYPDLEEVIAQHKIVYYEASRGCPFRCSYCLSSVDHGVRQRPLALVLADMDRLAAAGAPLVKFVDRTYNLDENFYFPILRHLGALECPTTFHFEIKADLLSEQVLQFLATVPKGRFQFEAGIQSTNPATLEAINRTNDWPQLAVNCGRILAGGNIHLHTDLIAGLPYEGLEEWRKSFNDVFALGSPMLQLGFLKVLPGTQMAREAEQYGLVYMPLPPYEILRTKWLSYGELAKLRRFDKIFDVVHNGGFFPRYLQALLRDFPDAYSFFMYLTEHWPKDTYGNYNARTVAECLHQLFGSKYEKLLQEDIFQNIHNWKPEWLDWRPYSRRNLRKGKEQK